MSDNTAKELYEFVLKCATTCVDAANALNIPHEQVVAALKSLETRDVLQSTLIKQKVLKLTPLGEESSRLGTPEFRLYENIPSDGVLKSKIDSSALPAALRRGLIRLDSSLDKKDPILFKTAINMIDDVGLKL